MNCKPGDLAVIVRDEEPAVDIGKMVKVSASSFIDDDGCFCWVCDSLSGPLRFWSGVRFEYAADAIEIPDAWLKPIRDPGNDAQDETLLWAGLPVKEVA